MPWMTAPCVSRPLAGVLALAALAGCASPVPSQIREPAPGDLGLAQVQAEPQRHTGAPVRWGGTIVSVDNRPQVTTIVVVARPLDSSGRPREGDGSLGRFLAQVEGFLDPAVYAPQRQITVFGHVEGAMTRAIGEHPYRYPVVKVRTLYLWEPPPEHDWRYYDPYWPYWYDPFYRPYPWWY
ncbi:MAG: Slp/YeaY family lipoprotein [Gammaproteobacteria bacterium]|nr:Slp/YeaY family lipoprotein [Gammaproteobacteria bacterium]NIR98879.1 Slp/YeaY family lipoprotein [Gammaproteobacteria bacterium]NIT64000.1 Slp/YeaY family lipoprotein [Gammaproteobacteria bacterium]NIV19160.1 Slp/YeaY family lipoprotein [Gammaproteobacteria bacterium]NIX10329.1 Slp/YeaY family lipoprotein [Gammaproteobacteria bacterium]